MLDKQHRFLSLALLLIGANACERLPLSLGQGVDGIDDLLGGDSNGNAGAGGSGSTWGSDACNSEHAWCLASGEELDVCEQELGHCIDGSAGSSGEPAPNGGTAGFAGAGGSGVDVDPTSGTGSAGTGAGVSGGASAGEDPVAGIAGFAGTGGTGSDVDPSSGAGAGGAAGDECQITHRLCLESGELPEVCRDVYAGCLPAAGAAGTGGAGG